MSKDAPLTPDFNLLPNDPQLLKQMIAELMVELSKKDGRIEQLQHRMDLLLRRLYGASSEKFDPRQASLFETTPPEPAAAETIAEPAADNPPAVEPETSSTTSSRSGHGRRKLPDTLKTVEVIHDLTETEKAAMGGAENLICIGQEETEQVEWEPSCLYRILHIQKKYARKVQLPESGPGLNEKNVILARKPPQPIEGGLPGPNLLAQVATCKFMDHIPLYRFERISERSGWKIPRSTTCDWLAQAAQLLVPIYQQMKEQLLRSCVIHLDDTPVNVQDPETGQISRAFFWTYVGDEEHPQVVIDFRTDRSRAGPREFLGNFTGTLQGDAYAGYASLLKEAAGKISLAGCWAHARRKFDEAIKTDRLRSEVAMLRISELYRLERELRERAAGEWKEMSWSEQCQLIAQERTAKSLPILLELKTWLEEQIPLVNPLHPWRRAAEYTLSEWECLAAYVSSGALDIDNNVAERSLRGIALGRKNWLFVGSEQGGHTAALYFSLMATCQRRGVEPFAYLARVFRELPLLLEQSGGEPSVEQILTLLP
jgi:transposase